MKDTFGRTIDYLRISVTDRCNFRCIYCMPEQGVVSMSPAEILRGHEIVTIARIAAECGIKRIRLTGGEPLVRKGMVENVREIAAIPGIEDISMTTNGVLLPKFAKDLKEAGLARVNISLDTLDADKFAFVTRGGKLQSTLDGIEAAFAAGLDPVKVNAVVVRSLDQDLLEFAKMTIDRPLHMRFIEYMPVGESSGTDGSGWGIADVISCEEMLRVINAHAAELGIPALEPTEDKPRGGGPARYYRFPGAQGTVGFISPVSNHFCSECNRVRLSADGKLRTCLFSDDELDIKTALREGGEDAARAVFEQAVFQKPKENENTVGTKRKMSQIGG